MFLYPLQYKLFVRKRRAAVLPSGFTLIELLVVVLIVGILSAVALPQYQKAVLKSRLAALQPLIRSVADAQERFYLANGSYAGKFDQLDIEIPPEFNNHFAIYGNADGWQNARGTMLFIGSSGSSVMVYNRDWKLGFQFYMLNTGSFYAEWQGKQICVPLSGNKTAEEVCKSLGGVKTGGYVSDGLIVGGGYYRYVM